MRLYDDISFMLLTLIVAPIIVAAICNYAETKIKEKRNKKEFYKPLR